MPSRPPNPAEPRKIPRQTRSAATVDAILDATAHILRESGFATLSTNGVAQRAGVSIGSLYQYFPNKEALLAALHARHSNDMVGAIGAILTEEGPEGLRFDIARLVRAAISAHEADPALHRILDRELPLFAPQEPIGARIHDHIVGLLRRNHAEVQETNLDLAAWITMQMTESLVHAAVLDRPPALPSDLVEAAINRSLLGYLTGSADRTI